MTTHRSQQVLMDPGAPALFVRRALVLHDECGVSTPDRSSRQCSRMSCGADDAFREYLDGKSLGESNHEPAAAIDVNCGNKEWRDRVSADPPLEVSIDERVTRPVPAERPLIGVRVSGHVQVARTGDDTGEERDPPRALEVQRVFAGDALGIARRRRLDARAELEPPQAGGAARVPKGKAPQRSQRFTNGFDQTTLRCSLNAQFNCKRAITIAA